MSSSGPVPADGAEHSLAGVTLDGRYCVSSTLGAGGMATVYLATDTRLGRSVVVKMPHTALAAQPDFLARFQREIASLTKIEHPHVVKVHDTGSFGGLPYAVLQHLSGGSLRDRLDKAGGKLEPAAVLPWLLQVAEALDHIHGKGMVHRDVKPGNILYDDAGNVVLADFGIAKAMGHLDTGITTTGVTPGSPGYMAPEVIRGGELGPRYDQFSLAVCVYEALSGRLPHEGTTPLELLTNLIHHSAADLAPLAPGIPPDAVSAVMKAISRDPSKRFATCTDFAKSFQQALGVPTIQVFPQEFAAGDAAETLAARRGRGWTARGRGGHRSVRRAARLDGESQCRERRADDGAVAGSNETRTRRHAVGARHAARRTGVGACIAVADRRGEEAGRGRRVRESDRDAVRAHPGGEVRDGVATVRGRPRRRRTAARGHARVGVLPPDVRGDERAVQAFPP